MAKEQFDIPQHVIDFIKEAGYGVPYSDMKPYIDTWYQWMKADGAFYNFDGTDANGRFHKMHRLSCRPARKVCREWASLLLNDKTSVATDDDKCNIWLEDYLHSIGFWTRGQGLIERAFGLGTGAWALWIDTDAMRPSLQLRRYDARMIIPLSWDDDGISECAFCTRVSVKGRQYDQLQMHLEIDGTYHIITQIWTRTGVPVALPEGINPDFDTMGSWKTFAIVEPAIENSVVDLSPYGESVFADAIDAIQAVDISFDAIYSEVKLGKMRVFMGDMLFDTIDADGKKRLVPFGIDDDVIIRKVTTTESVIETFAPQLRTDAQVLAYVKAWQTLGDNCGFGKDYFSAEGAYGGPKTATEVASDTSDLMRNIKKHENSLADAIGDICHAALHAARTFLGEPLGDEGEIIFLPDDSIITDTAAQKAQDLTEISAGVRSKWEYRRDWYGEDDATAQANVPRDSVDFDLMG